MSLMAANSDDIEEFFWWNYSEILLKSIAISSHEISINSMILSPNVCRINNFSLEPISMLHSSFLFLFQFPTWGLQRRRSLTSFNAYIWMRKEGTLAILLQHILMIENVHLHNFDIRNIVTCINILQMLIITISMHINQKVMTINKSGGERDWNENRKSLNDDDAGFDGFQEKLKIPSKLKVLRSKIIPGSVNPAKDFSSTTTMIMMRLKCNLWSIYVHNSYPCMMANIQGTEQKNPIKISSAKASQTQQRNRICVKIFLP